MISVKNLIEHLKTYPKDAMVYGYEGEDVGIGILSGSKGPNGFREYLGFITASEQEKPEEDRPPAKFRKRFKRKK